MGFIKFMGSTAGRWTRAIVGLAFIAWGIATNNWVLDVLGAVFVAVGVFDICLFAPLFGKPLSGPALRASFAAKKSATKK